MNCQFLFSRHPLYSFCCSADVASWHFCSFLTNFNWRTKLWVGHSVASKGQPLVASSRFLSIRDLDIFATVFHGQVMRNYIFRNWPFSNRQLVDLEFLSRQIWLQLPALLAIDCFLCCLVQRHCKSRLVCGLRFCVWAKPCSYYADLALCLCDCPQWHRLVKSCLTSWPYFGSLSCPSFSIVMMILVQIFWVALLFA